ncbi:MAG: class I SAM-dependent methyltransferase [Candidatus Omnitrophica bacterium]|nr:class I SAM-dependent methyltransferase [Candidatus Omnitrophota bacterium]
MRLPDKKNIYVTGKTDPAHRHYHPLINYFMNKRLTGALEVMGKGKCGRLLDVGFGGGIFLPELSSRCAELYGVDIHQHIDKVKEMLAKENVPAALLYGSVTNLPFPDEYFDRVVCVSVLEFVSDLWKAFSELARVVKKDGEMIIGFPVENVFTDMAFLMIGINARKRHRVNQDDILQAAKAQFEVDKVKTFPLGLPLKLALFAHCRLRKK